MGRIMIAIIFENAEIQNLDVRLNSAFGCEQSIVRRHISINDAVLMRKLHNLANLQHDIHSLSWADRSLLIDPFGKRDARYILENHKELPTVDHSAVEHRHQMWVTERSDCPRLPLEPFHF